MKKHGKKRKELFMERTAFCVIEQRQFFVANPCTFF